MVTLWKSVPPSPKLRRPFSYNVWAFRNCRGIICMMGMALTAMLTFYNDCTMKQRWILGHTTCLSVHVYVGDFSYPPYFTLLAGSVKLQNCSTTLKLLFKTVFHFNGSGEGSWCNSYLKHTLKMSYRYAPMPLSSHSCSCGPTHLGGKVWGAGQDRCPLSFSLCIWAGLVTHGRPSWAS